MGKMKTFLLFLLTLLVIYFTFFPKSAEMLSGNYVFGFDQGRDYLAVKSIVVDRNVTLIGSELGAGSAGIQGVFHGPGHYYFLAIPFLILDGDPYGGIILMFLFSVLAILCGIYLGRLLFNSYVPGLLFALLLSLSPSLAAQARFVWNSHPSSFFVMLVFIFFYFFLASKKLYFLFLSSFFAGFIYNFQTAIAIPFCLSIIVFLLCIRFREKKGYASVLVGYLLAFLPMILFEVKHGFQAIRGYLIYLQNPLSIKSNVSYVDAVLKDHAGSFIFNFSNSFPQQTIIPTIVIFILLAIGLLISIKKDTSHFRKQFVSFCLLIPLGSFGAFSLFRNSVYQHYLTHLNIIYLFFLSYIIYSLWSIRNKASLVILCFMCLFIGVVMLQEIPKAYTTFIKDYNDYGGDAKVRGKLDAIDYIYKEARGKPFNVHIFTPPVYTYAYDYLIWWRSKEKFRYMPGKEKTGTMMLVMEKDPGKPWSYKGWQETVIKVGKVIYTKTLPSGIIVEKRVTE